MHSRRWHLVSGAVLALAALTLPLSYADRAGADAGAGAHRSLSVEGYVVGWGGGAAAYLKDRRAVDEIGVDGVEVTSSADGVTSVAGPAKKALRTAHRHHDTAELLVSNYSDSLGDFDPVLAHTMLTSPDHRRAVASALARIVRRQGWDGIQIDLESLARHDGHGLAAFATELRADLPSTASLSMAVMAEGSHASYRRHGYLLASLDAVDRFVLMAYDQHGPGWSGPGPVGALPWARRTAAPLVAAVGGARVDLGIAGYGYLWHPDGSGRSVSDSRARQLAGGAAHWHGKAGEWSAHTAKGTLWWSDHRSYLRRVRLARKLSLHGVAVWQLGSADPLAG
ncbi:MAG: glycosyl hydrolase family 18 protein [Nocardioides sp.]